MKRLPTYRFHKASNQAICRIANRTYYLGSYDSKESHEKFNRLVAEYLTNPSFGIEKSSLSIAEAVVRFLRFAQEYYRNSREYTEFCRACRPLVDLFGDMHVSEFSVQEFKSYRQSWISKGSARTYVNKQCQRIVAVIKWWVSEKIVAPTLVIEVKSLAPLRRGRCDCPETEPVKPVDDATIEKTIPHLSPVVADMVRLQSLIGCRPGELVKLNPAMVDTSNAVWIIKLDEHKNSWRGHDRLIYVGPKGQAILKPYLDRPKDAFCFSPAESVEQRLQARSSKRITAMSCGNCRGSNRKQAPKRKPGASFTTGSYGRAIAYACTKANLPVWSPNQLRHAVATKLRDAENIESASLILGHKHLPTTEIYAEASTKKALEVALRHG